LNKVDKTAVAIKILTWFVNADVNTLDPDSVVENTRQQEMARQLLADWQ